MAFQESGKDGNSHKGKSPPPDDTRQEAAYLKMLGEKQRPVRIKLMDGDIVRVIASAPKVSGANQTRAVRSDHCHERVLPSPRPRLNGINDGEAVGHGHTGDPSAALRIDRDAVALVIIGAAEVS